MRVRLARGCALTFAHKEPPRRRNSATIRPVRASSNPPTPTAALSGSSAEHIKTLFNKSDATPSDILYDLGEQNAVSSVTVADERMFLVSSNKIHVRFLATEDNLGIINPASAVNICVVDERNRKVWVATAGDSVLRVYLIDDLEKPLLQVAVFCYYFFDLPSLTFRAQLTSHRLWVTCVQVYDASLVISASADQTLRIWKATSNKSAVLKGHTDYVTCMLRIPNPSSPNDPPLLVSGSCDKSIRFWNVQTATQVRVVFGHDAWVWALCLEGKVMLGARRSFSF